jgi:hypothetical protein
VLAELGKPLVDPELERTAELEQAPVLFEQVVDSLEHHGHALLEPVDLVECAHHGRRVVAELPAKLIDVARDETTTEPMDGCASGDLRCGLGRPRLELRDFSYLSNSVTKIVRRLEGSVCRDDSEASEVVLELTVELGRVLPVAPSLRKASLELRDDRRE